MAAISGAVAARLAGAIRRRAVCLPGMLATAIRYQTLTSVARLLQHFVLTRILTEDMPRLLPAVCSRATRQWHLCYAIASPVLVTYRASRNDIIACRASPLWTYDLRYNSPVSFCLLLMSYACSCCGDGILENRKQKDRQRRISGAWWRHDGP